MAVAFWSIPVHYASGSAAQAKAAVLSAPTQPTAVPSGTAAISVGWTLPADQLAGARYQVVRSSGPGSPTTVCSVVTTTSSCDDTGLQAGTTYGYTIVAVLDHWQTPPIMTSTTTGSAQSQTTTQTTSPTTTTTAVATQSSAATTVASSTSTTATTSAST